MSQEHLLNWSQIFRFGELLAIQRHTDAAAQVVLKKKKPYWSLLKDLRCSVDVFNTCVTVLLGSGSNILFDLKGVNTVGASSLLIRLDSLLNIQDEKMLCWWKY